ncbi:cyclic nucleotide-binding protein [Thiovulum sp. ES]|nr:cyclic nucleotide-binding protein [Thiovulum sp. ES]
MNFLKIRKKFNIFQGLTDEEALSVIQDIKISTFKYGDFVFYEGDITKDFYYILEGEVTIVLDKFLEMTNIEERSKKEESFLPTKLKSSNILERFVEITTLKKGDIFGEISFLANEPRNAGVRIKDKNPVTLLSFQIKENDDAIDNKNAQISLYKNITKLLVRKLKNTNKIVAGLKII